ncbi:MAG TPA: ABC transporter substrate-binding protein [Candidatus Latescibacteria bacterium]|nr:ABC transporter substrate-binding protein [Candidatus Latescibacterota bacterium]
MASRPSRVVFEALVALCACAAVAVARPYSDFRTLGAGFHETTPTGLDTASLSCVRIGVFAPLSSPDGATIVEGVLRAVSVKNASGGYFGKPFEAVVQNTDGAWGVAAQKVVALAYDETVWGIIGGVDGHQTHLAELIAAKAWVPILSPWASDLTVDYANVPWVFRTVPDDLSQASSLVDYARSRGISTYAVITEGSREGTIAGNRFIHAIGAVGGSVSIAREWAANDSFVHLAALVHDAAPGAVAIWGNDQASARFSAALRRIGYHGLLLAGAPCVSHMDARRVAPFSPFVAAAPFDFSVLPNAWGNEPKRAVFYSSFETANLLMSAICQAGLDRGRIRDAISKTRFNGVLGHTSFDSLGGTEHAPVLLQPANDGWKRVD